MAEENRQSMVESFELESEPDDLDGLIAEAREILNEGEGSVTAEDRRKYQELLAELEKKALESQSQNSQHLLDQLGDIRALLNDIEDTPQSDLQRQSVESAEQAKTDIDATKDEIERYQQAGEITKSRKEFLLKRLDQLSFDTINFDSDQEQTAFKQTVQELRQTLNLLEETEDGHVSDINGPSAEKKTVNGLGGGSESESDSDSEDRELIKLEGTDSEKMAGFAELLDQYQVPPDEGVHVAGKNYDVTVLRTSEADYMLRYRGVNIQREIKFRKDAEGWVVASEFDGLTGEPIAEAPNAVHQLLTSIQVDSLRQVMDKIVRKDNVINQLEEDELKAKLQEIKGIGETRGNAFAEAIVEMRNEGIVITSQADLIRITNIGPKRSQKIAEKFGLDQAVTFDPAYTDEVLARDEEYAKAEFGEGEADTEGTTDETGQEELSPITRSKQLLSQIRSSTSQTGQVVLSNITAFAKRAKSKVSQINNPQLEKINALGEAHPKQELSRAEVEYDDVAATAQKDIENSRLSAGKKQFATALAFGAAGAAIGEALQYFGGGMESKMGLKLALVGVSTPYFNSRVEETLGKMSKSTNEVVGQFGDNMLRLFDTFNRPANKVALLFGLGGDLLLHGYLASHDDLALPTTTAEGVANFPQSEIGLPDEVPTEGVTNFSQSEAGLSNEGLNKVANSVTADDIINSGQAPDMMEHTNGPLDGVSAVTATEPVSGNDEMATAKSEFSLNTPPPTSSTTADELAASRADVQAQVQEQSQGWFRSFTNWLDNLGAKQGPDITAASGVESSQVTNSTSVEAMPQRPGTDYSPPVESMNAANADGEVSPLTKTDIAMREAARDGVRENITATDQALMSANAENNDAMAAAVANRTEPGVQDMTPVEQGNVSPAMLRTEPSVEDNPPVGAADIPADINEISNLAPDNAAASVAGTNVEPTMAQTLNPNSPDAASSIPRVEAFEPASTATAEAMPAIPNSEIGLPDSVPTSDSAEVSSPSSSNPVVGAEAAGTTPPSADSEEKTKDILPPVGIGGAVQAPESPDPNLPEPPIAGPNMSPESSGASDSNLDVPQAEQAPEGLEPPIGPEIAPPESGWDELTIEQGSNVWQTIQEAMDINNDQTQALKELAKNLNPTDANLSLVHPGDKLVDVLQQIDDSVVSANSSQAVAEMRNGLPEGERAWFISEKVAKNFLEMIEAVDPDRYGAHGQQMAEKWQDLPDEIKQSIQMLRVGNSRLSNEQLADLLKTIYQK